MANTKISALTAGAPAVGTDLLPIARGGANDSLKVSDLVAISSAAGLGGCFIGWDSIPNTGFASGTQAITAANIVDAWQFVQRYPQTITRLAIRVATTFGVSSHVGVALYDSTGARVATTGALDGTNVSATQVVTIASVTLSPGIYYVGVSSDGATTGRLLSLAPASSVASLTQFSNTARGNRVVTGASASAGGVPPATLGVLSAQSTTVPPVLWVEP